MSTDAASPDLRWGASALVLLLLPPAAIALAMAEASLGTSLPGPDLTTDSATSTALWFVVVGALVLTYVFWPVYTLVAVVVAASLVAALITRRRRPGVAAAAAQTASTVGWVTVLGYLMLCLVTLVTMAVT